MLVVDAIQYKRELGLIKQDFRIREKNLVGYLRYIDFCQSVVQLDAIREDKRAFLSATIGSKRVQQRREVSQRGFQ